MKNHDDEDEIPAEVDFSRGVRGHFAGRVVHASMGVVIEPDLARAFPSSDAVNEALRQVLASRDKEAA